ncbi:protein of unknown function (plasmid) [Cupriavidus taiwanensis]|nr:protein of unknown function [Cupriavidus taiwanensis]
MSLRQQPATPAFQLEGPHHRAPPNRVGSTSCRTSGSGLPSNLTRTRRHSMTSLADSIGSGFRGDAFSMGRNSSSGSDAAACS